MIKLIRCELKKFFKNKLILSSLLILVLFLVLCVYACRMTKIQTVFDLQYTLLINLGSFYVIPFFIAISSYAYTVENDYNTLKIIKSKDIRAWKVYLSKFIVGGIYTFLILAILFIIPFFDLGRYTLTPMQFQVTTVINTLEQSCRFICLLYMRQFLASLFIVAFALFLSVVTNSKVIPILGVFVLVMFSSILTGIYGYGLKVIALLLPINSENIYAEYAYNTVNQRLVSLVVYIIVLSITSVYFYHKKKD